MTVKNLIEELLDYPMNMKINVACDDEHGDGFGGTCKGYTFKIQKIEKFAGEANIVFDDWRKGEHITTLATKEPNKMIYIGFSQHDAEAWYKCPVCNQQYGSWGFINGSVKVSDDGTFKCECGTILVKPK